MNAEFNWWLLIVGLVIGAGLVYLVLADSSRREADVLAEEVPREATWIAASMTAEGRTIDPPTAERVLELHRAYLAGPPPDPVDDEDFEALDDRETYGPPVRPEPAERYPDRPTKTAPESAAAAATAPGSGLGHDPDVERDAAEAQPPHRDVDQPR